MKTPSPKTPKKCRVKATPTTKSSSAKKKAKDRKVSGIPHTDGADAMPMEPKTPTPKKTRKRKAVELDGGSEDELESSLRTVVKGRAFEFDDGSDYELASSPRRVAKRMASELNGSEDELASSPRTVAKSPRTPARKKKKKRNSLEIHQDICWAEFVE
jgi:hypothetical protein